MCSAALATGSAICTTGVAAATRTKPWVRARETGGLSGMVASPLASGGAGMPALVSQTRTGSPTSGPDRPCPRRVPAGRPQSFLKRSRDRVTAWGRRRRHHPAQAQSGRAECHLHQARSSCGRPSRAGRGPSSPGWTLSGLDLRGRNLADADFSATRHARLRPDRGEAGQRLLLRHATCRTPS